MTKLVERAELLDRGAQEQYVKMLALSLYGMQSTRVKLGNRIAAFARLHGDSYGELVEDLKVRMWALADQMEKNIERDLAKAVSKLPIMRWLEQVRGIGPRLSGSLVGMLAPISRFRTVSAKWSYVGYGVIMGCQNCVTIYLEGKDRSRFLDRQSMRRWDIYATSKKYLALVDRIGDDPDALGAFNRKHKAAQIDKWYGEAEEKLCSCDSPNLQSVAADRKYYGGLILPYHTFLKATCWKVGDQFVRQGGFYREHYDRYKDIYLLSRPDMSAGRNDNSARRATVKLFLSHLWQMWRTAEGLPVGQVYLQDRLGEKFAAQHQFIEPPYADVFDKK